MLQQPRCTPRRHASIQPQDWRCCSQIYSLIGTTNAASVRREGNVVRRIFSIDGKVLPYTCQFSRTVGKVILLDAYDWKILAELQANGRLTLTELAERIGLSLSPCHRRVRALEASGAIRDYRARVSAEAVGLNFSALVFVTLRDGDRQAIERFESDVRSVKQVTQAQRLFGDPDYLLQVVTRDLPAFQRLYDERLSKLPGVQRLTSTLVMKSIIEDGPLPTEDA